MCKVIPVHRHCSNPASLWFGLKPAYAIWLKIWREKNYVSWTILLSLSKHWENSFHSLSFPIIILFIFDVFFAQSWMENPHVLQRTGKCNKRAVWIWPVLYDRAEMELRWMQQALLRGGVSLSTPFNKKEFLKQDWNGSS